MTLACGSASGDRVLAKGTDQQFRRDRRGLSIRVGAFEIRKSGIARFDLKDPYYLALSLSGPQFLGLLTALYLAINILFALLYAAVPGCVDNVARGSWLDAFFFSIETLATVGYGRMVPITPYGHVVSSLEIFIGTGFTAVLTGLVFVRFSRPKSMLVYAERPVVTTYGGKPALMVRVGNGRSTVLTRATAQMTALMMEDTVEGHRFRRPVDLTLVRSAIAIFPLTWTLIHTLDEASPLHGWTADRLGRDDVRLFVSITARDATATAEISDVKTYGAEEIAFGMRYADAVLMDEAGHTVADMRRISEMEPG